MNDKQRKAICTFDQILISPNNILVKSVMEVMGIQ